MELLIAFLPALVIAGRHGSTAVVGGIGLVFVVARAWYAVAYIRNPVSRGLPFTLSMMAVSVLVVFACVGIVRTLL